MSALGQKRTFCDAEAMSALPPTATAKADISNLCPLSAKSGQLPIISTGDSCERANQSQPSIPGQLICARCRRYVLDACA
jgi:hypothetical protein